MPDADAQEVIRVEEDGTPVYADWDESSSAARVVPIDGAARARSESRGRVADKTEVIKARLAELGVALELTEQLMNKSSSVMLSGVDRWYSASEAARFFNRSPAWIYDRLARKKFHYANGEEIAPHYDGDPNVKRPRARFNLELIREIALSCYRSGTVKYEELELIMTRVGRATIGEVIFEEPET